MTDKSLVSVVIPTFNSERYLESCLRSVKRQSYSKIEIIAVDNYSTDKTREVLENFGAKVVLCRTNMSKGRNVGIDLSKGEFILSLDSDMELKSNVIRNCVAKMMNGFDAVIIPELSVGEGFWAACRALEKLCYIGDDSIEATRFFRKDVFDSINGYDDRLVFGEDWDLNQRIKEVGFRVGRVSSFIKHNEGKLSLQQTMLKKNSYGKSLKEYCIKHPKESKQQLTLIRPAFIKNWKKLVRDPFHFLGLIVLKTCEFAYCWIGSKCRN